MPAFMRCFGTQKIPAPRPQTYAPLIWIQPPPTPRAGPLAAAPHPARGAQRGAFLGPRLAPGLGLRPRSTLGQCRGVCHRRDYFTYLKNNNLTTLRNNLRQLQSRPMCGFAFEGRSFTQPFRCASGCACAGQGLANICATSPRSTSSICAGLQRGVWSLSTASARMPSSVSLLRSARR